MSLKFGIVGTGMIASVHAQVLNEIPNATLVGAVSRSPQRGQEFAARHECRAFADVREMTRDVDAVSICTPSGLHLNSALEAIDAGCAVIIEKPLEITVARCRQILEAGARRGVPVAGVFQSRFLDSSRVLKAAIDDGRFGKLSLGDAYVKWYRSQEYYSHSRWKGTQLFDGGGALMNQGIHAVDLLQWFMGPVREVQARTAVRGHSGIEVEDTAVAALEFESGALGVIEGSTAAYPGFLKRIEVSGIGGTAILEEESLTTWAFTEERDSDEEVRRRLGPGGASAGGASDPAAISSVGHRRQFEDFIGSIVEGREPFVSGDEACKAVSIIEAIYISNRTGRAVIPGAT